LRVVSSTEKALGILMSFIVKKLVILASKIGIAATDTDQENTN
jgi:hypothetical protein